MYFKKGDILIKKSFSDVYNTDITVKLQGPPSYGRFPFNQSHRDNSKHWFSYVNHVGKKYKGIKCFFYLENCRRINSLIYFKPIKKHTL